MKVVEVRLVEGRKIFGSTVLELVCDDGSIIETTRARFNKVRKYFDTELATGAIVRIVEAQVREHNEGVARELGEEVPDEYL